MQLKRDDRGVTLIEVLVSIVILGIIIAPLSAGLIAFLRNTDDTTARLSESHDMQISAAYFAKDVQAIGVRDWTTAPYRLQQSIALGAAAGSAFYPCGAGGTPAAIVSFAWDDPTSALGVPAVIRVSYVVTTVGGERQLHRVSCGSTASIVVLVHNLDATAPTVTCSTACTSAPAVPQTVTLVLMIKDPGSSGPAVPVTLSGQRRQT